MTENLKTQFEKLDETKYVIENKYYFYYEDAYSDKYIAYRETYSNKRQGSIQKNNEWNGIFEYGIYIKYDIRDVYDGFNTNIKDKIIDNPDALDDIINYDKSIVFSTGYYLNGFLNRNQIINDIINKTKFEIDKSIGLKHYLFNYGSGYIDNHYGKRNADTIAENILKHPMSKHFTWYKFKVEDESK